MFWPKASKINHCGDSRYGCGPLVDLCGGGFIAYSFMSNVQSQQEKTVFPEFEDRSSAESAIKSMLSSNAQDMIPICTSETDDTEYSEEGDDEQSEAEAAEEVEDGDVEVDDLEDEDQMVVDTEDVVTDSNESPSLRN